MDVRRLYQIHPGGHRCQPDSFLAEDAFQLSLGFCWKERNIDNKTAESAEWRVSIVNFYLSVAVV